MNGTSAKAQPMSVELSIIIVSYRTKDILRDCLLSIRRNVDVAHEVIVVDNASTDGSPEMVAHEFPEFTLVANVENVGFSPANNTGMARAQGKYILLLNPDTVVLPGSIPLWLNAHERRGAAISGPRLLNVDGSLQPSAWKIPGLWNALLEVFYLHRVVGIGRYATGRFTADFEPGFVSGAAMLFHSTLFHRSGGLDPEMFWMEDVDLCVRARKAGGSIHYFHAPTIVHLGGQSAKKNLDRVISNQLISRLKFARKHGSRTGFAFLVLVVQVHVITRIIIFTVLGLFRSEPRAKAYRHTAKRLYNYLFHGDRSI